MASFATIQHTTAVPAQAKEAENILQKQEEQQTNEQSSGGFYGGLASPGFSIPKSGADFSSIPTRPSLQTGLSVQCCGKDGKPCSCPKCKKKAEQQDEEPAMGEATDETTSSAEETTSSTSQPQPEATTGRTTPSLNAQPETEPAATSSASPLIVDDTSAELTEGQMKKTEFLQQLRADICAAIGPVLATAGQTTEGCPYLNYWLNLYEQKSAAEVEATVKKYAPDSTRATTAAEYISLVTQRALRAAEIWAQTGRLSGIPEGVPTTIPGGAGSQQPEDEQASAVQPKAKEGGAKNLYDPHSIKKELGNGQPLSSYVRSRMEPSLGMNFSNVRTHTDSTASAISNRVNARAFTVGEHIAFANGEYQPGTMLGDALIAHELAHVVQQNGAGESVANMEVGDSGYDALEKDADIAAASTVASLWHNVKEATGNGIQQAVPHLRSGLRLSRCNEDPKPKPAPKKPPAPAAPAAALTIKVLKPPETTSDCGGVLSQVRWEVPSTSPDGTIVQHLQAGYDKLNKCDGTKHNSIFHPNDPFEFYEAWEVKGGKIFIGWAADGGGEHRSDTFSGLVDYGSGTTGKGKATGKVAFLPGYTKTTESGWGPHRFAGTLPTRSTPPAGWSGATKLDHWLSTEWDCCPTDDSSKWTKTKVDGAPKS